MFKCQVEIRFNDIDIYGHVNNAVYLSYMEQARVKFFNHYFPHHSWNKTGIIVANIQVNYLKPIFFSPLIDVEIGIEKIGGKSFTMGYHLLQDNEVKANALSTLVCIDYQKNQTIDVPVNWRELFVNFIKQ
jgi:acyl-CoA thioester hydrolase